MHYWMWLALAGGFLILEILTLGLFFLSFAIAAVIGALCAAIWPGAAIQWIAFAISAMLTLSVIRPILRKSLYRKSSGANTGIDALIDQHAVTLTEVTPDTGTVRLQNETWTARSDSGIIPAGYEVRVVRIDGAVAIVAPKISNTTV